MNNNQRGNQRPQRPQQAQRPTQRPTRPPMQKKSSDKQQVFLAKLLIFLVAFAMIVFVLVICIGCKYNESESSADTDTKITVDVGDTTVDDDASLSTFMEYNVLYVNFTELALKCDMSITGTKTEQTFSVTNGDKTETMTVTDDSYTVVINGESVTMPYQAQIRGSDVWLCADFIQKSVHGVTVNYNEETKVLTCKRTELNASTPENPLYENVTFAYNVTKPVDTVEQPTDTTPSVDTEKPTQNEKPKYDFKLDLSDYEQYMDPEDKDAYLTLVNKQNYLDKNYVPENLVKVYGAAGGNAKYYMVDTAAKAFEAMVKEAAANGYNIKPISGYRSYSTQISTFNNWLNIEINNAKKDNPGISETEAYNIGFAVCSMYSAPAGASEHQLGLAMDVNSLDESFGNTAEGKWLAENCYKFGFILRFPEDKTDITGYIYEPWHFRFVGRYHAERITKLGMTLEEYIVYLNKD